MTINEIIELGGLVELVSPLMIFVELTEDDGINPYDDEKFAIVWVKQGSILKLLKTDEHGVFGEIVSVEEGYGCVAEEGGATPSLIDPEELKDRRFISSDIELEKAIKVKVKK